MNRDNQCYLHKSSNLCKIGTTDGFFVLKLCFSVDALREGVKTKARLVLLNTNESVSMETVPSQRSQNFFFKSFFFSKHFGQRISKITGELLALE